ncbi:COG1361 S-layer family protein [Candidatus Woesearchaeota archaeon]|nr:COG1361 S-layer family protein [Candidatus Woesearchaeota archaeon]
MKRGLLLILFLLLIPLAIATTSSVSFGTNANSLLQVQVSIDRMVPSIVQPGEYFDLYLSLETEGVQSSTSIINTDDLQNVQLELIQDYPFSLDSDDDGIRSLGVVEPGKEYSLKYKVKVDEDASPDDYELKFLFSSSEDESKTTPALEIPVDSIDYTLNVVSIETEPELLSPGEPAELFVTIRNDAFSSFRNLEASLSIDSNTIPIVPYKSSKEQSLVSLSPGKEHTFTFNIIAEEDATAGVYKIPLAITYRDANGSAHYKNDTFGILIGSDADLSFNLEEFSAFKKGTNGEVIVSTSNIGPTEIKYLTLKILPGEGYEIIGPDSEYLGNLDSDDFETSSFDIYVKQKESVVLNLVANYKDSYNQEFEKAITLLLPVYTSSEIKSYGLDGNTISIWTLIFYILCIFFVYYSFKGWRREKKIDLALKHGLKRTIQLPFRILLFFSPGNLKKIPRKIRELFDDL